MHARPAADRCDRALGLRPGAARVRVPARPALRERRAGRRDQPRDAEDPVGPARGDGRAPDHGRRDHAAAPGPVPADRDREPDRVRGHVPAARGAARPLLPARDARLPRSGGGAAGRARAAARPPARPAGSGREPLRAERAPRGRGGRLSRRSARGVDRPPRPHDARARAGRGRRLRPRLARPGEDGACLGAAAGARPCPAGGRRASLHPRAGPPARPAGRLPRRDAERVVRYGPRARARPRLRAGASAAARLAPSRRPRGNCPPFRSSRGTG